MGLGVLPVQVNRKQGVDRVRGVLERMIVDAGGRSIRLGRQGRE